MKPNIFQRLMMTLLLPVLSAPTLSKSTASAIPAKEVTVRITNIDVKRSGSITLMLFSNTGFPKDHNKAVMIDKKTALQSTLEFPVKINLETFALKVLHDENDDGQVTKNWTGILPAEGLGFSNGAKIRFGPPSFKKAKLRLNNITDTINIALIYP
ncbi:DUF2141 domain-containing protein [Agaribacter flavus]|uniref:DUF2141 domain-containing protein n=1 Tax=Agaribacter flavus TaxID=1902781 RepID=A0ABV7FN45_9ALTE